MQTIFCCCNFFWLSSFVLFFFTQTFGADCHYQLETWSMDLGHLTGVPQDVSDCIYHNFLLPERTAVRWEGFKNRAFLQLTYSQENFLLWKFGWTILTKVIHNVSNWLHGELSTSWGSLWLTSSVEISISDLAPLCSTSASLLAQCRPAFAVVVLMFFPGFNYGIDFLFIVFVSHEEMLVEFF